MSTTTEPVKNKAEEQAARNDAETNVIKEAHEELLKVVMDHKEMCENNAWAARFQKYNDRVGTAVANFKEASKLKADCIETVEDIKGHTDAANELKAAVKDLEFFTLSARTACGDLFNFCQKHALFAEHLLRNAEWNATTGTVDIVKNEQS